MGELKILVPYFRPYRREFLTGLALVVVSNVFTTIGPRFLKTGIDALTRGAPFAEVRQAGLMLLAVAIAGGIARFGMRQLLNGASRRVETDLRRDLFAHLERMPAAFFGRYTIGDLMARATNDLLAVRMIAGPALMYLVDTFTRTLLLLPAMAAISPRLTALALLPVAGLPFAMIFLGNRIHYRSLAIQEYFGTVTAFVHEHLSGVRVVRAYRQEAAETRQFLRLNEEYVTRNMALARLQGVFNSLLTFLGGLGMAVVLYVGGQEVIAGKVSVGAFVAFGVYLGTLVWPMIALGWAVNLVQRGTAALKRIRALLAEEPAIRSPAVPRILPPLSGRGRLLEFEDV